MEISLLLWEVLLRRKNITNQQNGQKEKQLNRFLINNNEISTIALAKLIDNQQHVKIDDKIYRYR
ncbi:MAG: hypothetical protein AB8W37_00955 [Arsenophonus endosymbiont of Dermacentor nuttalli]